jgi:phosphoglycerol transferase MdoB-like AlkP superfamily enzyme
MIQPSNHANRVFVGKVKELGLDQSTEIVIYGDHITMGDMKQLTPGRRNLSVFMPLRQQDKLWKRSQGRQMSYRDFAPTIMDLLGIDYSPRFPFGKSLFGMKQGDVPTLNDMAFMYGLATGDRRLISPTCKGQPGLCRGLEHQDVILFIPKRSTPRR